ncbi:MAG: HAMP domain-containing histidine kinase [Bacteroidales bacterium]|nr:HAMP domain-containing histidine kinase [Bacteroidales bacterium]
MNYFLLIIIISILLIITIVLIFRQKLLIKSQIISKLNKINTDQKQELIQKNKEVKVKTDKLTEKAIDLMVLNREIRLQSKLREGLTGMIVHDLKNPISSIINISENKEVKFFAEEILTMVENILDVQKYEGMIMPLNKKEYNLKEISDNAIKQVELFAEHKNIKIENRIHSGLIVFADNEILRRIIVNLLSNSIKYSHANSSILINYETNKEKSKVAIKVVDTGIGVKEDKIDLIFSKFKQVMAKKTGMARSTGLGLTFCKIAVEAHNGKINVESIPDKYTVFSFSIDLAEENAVINNNKVPKRKTTKNVLIKKDEEYLQVFCKQLKNLEVYEISLLRKVTTQIDENFSEGIKKWKKKLNNAIYNCNPELYKEIINSVSEK